jgi:hypothetical protein
MFKANTTEEEKLLFKVTAYQQILNDIVGGWNKQLKVRGKNITYTCGISFRDKESILPTVSLVKKEGVLRITKVNTKVANEEVVICEYTSPMIKSSMFDEYSDIDFGICRLVLLEKVFTEMFGTYTVIGENMLNKKANHAKG